MWSGAIVCEEAFSESTTEVIRQNVDNNAYLPVLMVIKGYGINSQVEFIHKYGGNDTPGNIAAKHTRAHTRSLGCRVLAQTSPFHHHHHHQFTPGARRELMVVVVVRSRLLKRAIAAFTCHWCLVKLRVDYGCQGG